MADIEVPDPNEAEEKAGDPFTKKIALCVAVYAVALAVTALGGSNAGKDMVMAQQQASNQWAYYQAKVMRENMYILEAEKLQLDMDLLGTELKPAQRARMEQSRSKYLTKAEEYAKEKKDILEDAKKLEAERDVAARRDPYFDYAEVLLQIAIVLASVAMLSGKRWAFYGSLALAGLGVLLCTNGYGLFLKLPGLE
ncbi:hypothetical protein VT84_32925 [Gemmata sp. SH-PL17]|uniref:DUF4337 domain-containing protein n=1 Tax=Gemmata sp. SH-PL17 TaxID=1630693 RepID=UPI00078C13DD|nr:DUF4337 domain-containing protein [Gemmata sp. SH-PL17]AMV29245.1 hypothetical protein VT84_32925 [Gemmata sp. SH-PL17]